jgi:transcriptional regulator with XRE-family HTH domain
MPHSPPKIFPRIFIKKTTLEPHSRLYHLSPIGIGSQFVESLTSYISRLAEAHCCKVSALFQYEILPHLDMPYALHGSTENTGSYSFIGLKDIFEAVNGKSVSTTKFVAALEHLTKRQNLSLLTLLNWSDVLTSRNLLRKYRSWCPSCFDDWRSRKQVTYEPLMWSIDEVKICSIHQRYLISTCSLCDNQALVFQPKFRAGYCPVCEEWLGINNRFNSLDNRPAEAELRVQLWVNENVGDILASAPGVQSQLSQENLASSVSSIIDRRYGGVARRLARTLGKSKSTVWGWKNGKNIPSLKELLRVCYLVRISLLELLTSDGSIKTDGGLQQLPSNSKDQSIIVKASPKKIVDISEVRVRLRGFLNSDTEPIPMVQVADVLGYNVRVLRKKFPELCRQISHRYLNHIKTLREKKRSDFTEEIISAVIHLHSMGQPVTRERIADHVNKPSYKGNPRVCNPMREAKRRLGIP